NDKLVSVKVSVVMARHIVIQARHGAIAFGRTRRIEERQK
ncbi:MAG: hypothetical protein RL040_998, partial [Bacteroidota bacterium]